MGNRPRDLTIGCFATSNLSGRPSRQVSTTKRNLVAHLPWAHRIRLQLLLSILLTANVSNKSGNLLFAQSYPQWHENVGFLHSPCTAKIWVEPLDRYVCLQRWQSSLLFLSRGGGLSVATLVPPMETRQIPRVPCLAESRRTQIPVGPDFARHCAKIVPEVCD
jgi:hypothetical protein